MPYLFVVFLLATMHVPAAEAQWAGESVLIREAQQEDVYAAGRDVEILADVEQDVVAAGQRVSIGGRVGADLIAAAETVIVRGDVGDDVRAAGRSVTIFGKVGDHVVAAGETVSIDRGAEIGNRAWLAGETVRVGGRIGRELKAAGRNVVVYGEVGGDVEILAEEIEVQAGAIVRGDLIWRSEDEPEISPEARIEGRVIRQPVPEHLAERPVFPGGAFFGLGLLVAGVVLYLLFPGVWLSSALEAQGSPWTSLGLGIAVLVGAPLVVAVLFATVIGYVLALMMLALYVITLLLGALAGIFSVGDLGLRLLGKRDEASRGLRVLSIIAAVVVLVVIGLVPVLGGLVTFLVWLAGLGAIQLSLYRVYASARAA